MTSMLMNQQYVLRKVLLNRNTNKASLYIDWVTKMYDQMLQEPKPTFPLEAMVLHLLTQCSWQL